MAPSNRLGSRGGRTIYRRCERSASASVVELGAVGEVDIMVESTQSYLCCNLFRVLLTV